jgi:hypothetical protein
MKTEGLVVSILKQMALVHNLANLSNLFPFYVDL